MFKLIAGPCVIESKQLAIDAAGALKEITDELGIDFYYKSSFDKANRTSINSFRGLGFDEGLRILSEVKSQIGCKVLTDVHELDAIHEVAQVVDVLQTPAFLCRQTDFILKVASQGLPVNIKKGQWMSAWDMQNVLIKAKSTGNNDIWLCERGNIFGYGDMVVDFRNLEILGMFAPVVFDATHSAQKPANGNNSTGGDREQAKMLARCAVAAGVDGLFIETHPDPDNALSDGPNSIHLHEMKDLLIQLMGIHNAAI